MLVQPAERHACHPPKRPRVVTHPMPAHWSGGTPGEKVPVRFSVEALPGTLWRCGECQTWWVAFKSRTVYRGGVSPWSSNWRLVAMSRWALTDRKLRKRIAEAVAQEQDAIVAAWPDKVTDALIDSSAILRPLLHPVTEGPPPMPPTGGSGVHKVSR